MIVQKNAQDVTDAALNTSLKEMLHWNKNLNSQIVADVWGKRCACFLNTILIIKKKILILMISHVKN